MDYTKMGDEDDDSQEDSSNKAEEEVDSLYTQELIYNFSFK